MMILHCWFHIQFTYKWEFTITSRLIHSWRLFVQVSQRKCKSISIWQKKCTNRYILFLLGKSSVLLFRFRVVDIFTYIALQEYPPWRNINWFGHLRFFKSFLFQWKSMKCQSFSPQNNFNDTSQFNEDIM